MIVPMKKFSLIILGDKKTDSLQKLRELGIAHIEIAEGSGEKLAKLFEQIALLKNALFTIGKKKSDEQKEASPKEAFNLASEIETLVEEKKNCQSDISVLSLELERLKSWGEIDLESINALMSKGIKFSFYEMPKGEYKALPDDLETVKLASDRASVKFLLLKSDSEEIAEVVSAINGYKLSLPPFSTAEMREKINENLKRIEVIDKRMAELSVYTDSINKAINQLENEIEFETYATGMENENLSTENSKTVSVAYFKGYVEAENADKLKQVATDNSWGLVLDEPTEEDNVPTKLRNNRFVSLIYPLTDFLGTIPGYFEYDISGWFLAFILVFFGIIFGDGGYGLIILAIAAVLIAKSLITKKRIDPAFLLCGLFGLSTILWGTLTCTWFGLSPEQIPNWLSSLSIPVISNVYADKIWSLPWTPEGVGLTTAQNLQIFCFTLALIQLTVAHVIGVARNRRSLKLLGDIGSILQLFGIYYLVLSLVVNPEVFSLGLILGGVPVGTVAIVLIGVGFVMSFAFANFEGNIIKSLIASIKNIVSVLLGVVNVFSDIVSYIRLWAVGLAGAAISATVNELAGPLFGNFLFMVLAIVLLVFGHGLNMILNILSVIVHGIRLNTLEFSSHLDMSWSGHKFKPFEE